MESPKEITLEALLRSRDDRAARQRAWLRQCPERTLVCLTVVLPGAVKRDARSARIASDGVRAVREALSPSQEECLDLETGFEGYFLVPGDVLAVKRVCCRLEEEEPLGRLMDIDVLTLEGDAVVPVSRGAVGLPPRRCLLCDRPARECMRAHTHTREEVDEKIREMLVSASKL